MRLAICTAIAVVVAVTSPMWMMAMRALLHWFDHLAPKPGMSGLLLLAVAPFAFIILVWIGKWILSGFSNPVDGVPAK